MEDGYPTREEEGCRFSLKLEIGICDGITYRLVSRSCFGRVDVKLHAPYAEECGWLKALWIDLSDVHSSCSITDVFLPLHLRYNRHWQKTDAGICPAEPQIHFNEAPSEEDRML